MKKFLLTTFAIIASIIFILWLIFYFEIGKKEYTAEEWKAFSIENASKRLDQYVKLEGLNRTDFKGPYIRQTDNPDPPTFTTCYKSQTHHFCYHQGGQSSQGYEVLKVSCSSSICQWLSKQS